MAAPVEPVPPVFPPVMSKPHTFTYAPVISQIVRQLFPPLIFAPHCVSERNTIGAETLAPLRVLTMHVALVRLYVPSATCTTAPAPVGMACDAWLIVSHGADCEPRFASLPEGDT